MNESLNRAYYWTQLKGQAPEMFCRTIGCIHTPNLGQTYCEGCLKDGFAEKPSQAEVESYLEESEER